jgi:hypothetical protein
MDNFLPTALAIVLCINVMLFTAQLSILNVGIEEGLSPGTFYNAQGSLLCKMDGNNCSGTEYVLNDTDPTGLYPDNEPIDSGDGNFFTDMFGSIKTFFSDTLGLGYIMDILSAPTTILKMIGLPSEISFALGALWYAFSLLIILAFFWGR